VSLHNSGGELCLYTIQRGECLSTEFRRGIVSLHNSGGELSLYTIQGGIVSVHDSGGELSLYTIQGRDCFSLQYLGVFFCRSSAVPVKEFVPIIELKFWVPAALLFPGMC